MSNPLIDMRDALYTEIGIRKTALEYTINNFSIEKAWKPYKTLEALKAISGGIIYTICHVPGDWVINDRRLDASKRMYPVTVGYQRYLEDLSDHTVTDNCTRLLLEIEQTALEVSGGGLYTPELLTYLKDPQSDLPIRFAALREANVFEAYLQFHYSYVYRGEN